MRPLVLASVFAVMRLVAQTPADAVVIKGVFDRFTTDEIGHVYALQGDELALYDAKGKKLLRNSLKTFGSITAIDAFSSLKPMIFSGRQGMLAALDNTLAIQGDPIDLNRSGFPQVTLACMSVQNCFWLFDQREMALLRVDGQLKPMSNTGRLDQLLGFAPEPVAMQEHDSRLYVNSPAHGILVFDLFGTFVKQLPILGARGFQVRDGRLTYLDSAGAWTYDMRSFSIEPLTIDAPFDQVRELRVDRGMVHLLLADRILVHPLRPARR